MFTIGEGENHDPKSPGNSGVTTESIFSGPTPSNFWIVTSFVIPNDLKNKDWWVVAFIDEHGNVVEGFKEIFYTVSLSILMQILLTNIIRRLNEEFNCEFLQM